MKKFLLSAIISAVAVFVVSMVINYLFSLIFTGLKGEYENSNIFRPWGDPLMMIYFIYPLIFALIVAFVWDKVKSAFSGTYINKVVNFSLIYWLAASIPGMIMSLSSFKISLIMILSWTIGGLFQILTAAFITIKMND